MDFCMNMNTKSNRRKLVRALFTVPRQRSVSPWLIIIVLSVCVCLSVSPAEDAPVPRLKGESHQWLSLCLFCRRLDLLPFYSRLVATLHPCMSDVAEDLCSMLKGDFRFHVGSFGYCT